MRLIGCEPVTSIQYEHLAFAALPPLPRRVVNLHITHLNCHQETRGDDAGTTLPRVVGLPHVGQCE